MPFHDTSGVRIGPGAVLGDLLLGLDGNALVEMREPRPPAGEEVGDAPAIPAWEARVAQLEARLRSIELDRMQLVERVTHLQVQLGGTQIALSSTQDQLQETRAQLLMLDALVASRTWRGRLARLRAWFRAKVSR